MTNDINKILASKQSWKNSLKERRVDRRIKFGTESERKAYSDMMKSVHEHRLKSHSYCTCSICELHQRNKWPSWYRWVYRIWIKIMPVVIIFLICTNSYAYTASWYGTTGDTTDPWKHTVTANGERFNENALTAASWRYPLGSWVRVTNVANRRSVVVRINDRGPGMIRYRQGRIIDLTRGAFSRIANIEIGVIHVVVREI